MKRYGIAEWMDGQLEEMRKKNRKWNYLSPKSRNNGTNRGV